MAGLSKAPPGMRRALQLAVLALVCLLFVGAGDDARFDRLGHKLMCRCGCNQILLECNHVGCAYSDKMREQLMAALSGPGSDDLVLQGFVQEYGAVVLAAPTDKGFNKVAWITPFAVLGLGVFAVVYVVRRWKHRPPPPPQVATGGSPAHLELDSFREQARKETEL
jgi:cytochrome c-type biogenesis protein CcmH